MTLNQPFSPPPASVVLNRGDDRRQSLEVAAPPYVTAEGLVLVDRRSHLERRSCWIRAFALATDPRES